MRTFWKKERNKILQELIKIKFLQLKNISSDGVNLPETSFQLIGRLNNLESLNINDCIRGSAAFEIMEKPEKRITIENDFKEMLQSLHMLKNLVISDQWDRIFRDGTFLKYASYSVESIEMRFTCTYSSLEVEHLFTLGYRPALRELRLMDCRIADEDLIAILLSGAPNLEIFELKEIDLSINCEALAKLQNLQELHITSVYEPQDDSENKGWLTRFLEQVPHSEFQPSLSSLSLDCEEMHHEDGKKLVKNLACFTTLKELYLRDVKCLNEKLLETLFSSCKEIEVLNLVSCSTVDNAVLAVIGRLCPDLVNVDLWDSEPFSFEGVQALVDGVFGSGKRNPKKSLSINLPLTWEDSPFVETIVETCRSKLKITFFW